MTTGREKYLDRTRGIVLDALAGYPVTVYLFGSYSKGTETRTSDVDIAVEAHEPLPVGLLARLREALEESTVPLHVDVVDMSGTTAQFRNRVRMEGMVWNG